MVMMHDVSAADVASNKPAIYTISKRKEDQQLDALNLTTLKPYDKERNL